MTSSGAVVTRWALPPLRPLLNQEILGSGSPLALQAKVTGSFLVTEMFIGCSTILGRSAADKPGNKMKIVYLFLLLLVLFCEWEEMPTLMDGRIDGQTTESRGKKPDQFFSFFRKNPISK